MVFILPAGIILRSLYHKPFYMKQIFCPPWSCFFLFSATAVAQSVAVNNDGSVVDKRNAGSKSTTKEYWFPEWQPRNETLS